MPSPVATADPCAAPGLRERYTSDLRMQLTRADFATWCKSHLEAEAERKALGERVKRAATAPAAELCGWLHDAQGGPRFYVAVRADRLAGRPETEIPEPLQSYLRLEKLERYAGSAGLEGYIDKREREVRSLPRELTRVAASARRLQMDEHATIAEKLAKHETFSRSAWRELNDSFSEARAKLELDDYLAQHCIELVAQIDATP